MFVSLQQHAGRTKDDDQDALSNLLKATDGELQGALMRVNCSGLSLSLLSNEMSAY